MDNFRYGLFIDTTTAGTFHIFDFAGDLLWKSIHLLHIDRREHVSCRFLNRIFHQCKQGNSGNGSHNFWTGRTTCGRYEYYISTLFQLLHDWRSIRRSGQSEQWLRLRSKRSKALNIESQRGLRRYGVNHSSPTSPCLSLPLAAFRHFPIIKKRMLYFYKHKYRRSIISIQHLFNLIPIQNPSANVQELITFMCL